MIFDAVHNNPLAQAAMSLSSILVCNVRESRAGYVPRTGELPLSPPEIANLCLRLVQISLHGAPPAHLLVEGALALVDACDRDFPVE